MSEGRILNGHTSGRSEIPAFMASSSLHHSGVCSGSPIDRRRWGLNHRPEPPNQWTTSSASLATGAPHYTTYQEFIHIVVRKSTLQAQWFTEVAQEYRMLLNTVN